ncbi:hypothetical protein Lser_V15G31553 [Lactuca serriola]
MDTFVKKFFKNFHAPGLPFVQLEPGMINHTYMEGLFGTKVPHLSQHKAFFSVQPMTMLGRTTAGINSNTSSYDGICDRYITTQGNLDVKSICKTVLTMGYMQTDQLTMCSRSWSDNHTTLLVNALGYALITKAIETSGDIDNKLPEFTDGKIRIDPNYGMRTTTDSKWEKNIWPAGSDVANYPEMIRIVDQLHGQIWLSYD